MPQPIIVGIGEILWDMLPGGKQLGGAPANFAYHANALGARGVVISRVGDDDFGREIIARLESLGLDTRFVQRDPSHPTGRVDVRVDGRGVPDYVIHRNVAWDFIRADPELLQLAAAAADAVCFGTLAQRSPASREAIRSFLRATRPDCRRVFDINLRQSYYDAGTVRELMQLARVVKLHDEELPVVARLLSSGADDSVPPNDPESVARWLIDQYPLELVALTRGPRGSVLYTGRDTFEHPGHPATVADTVGAGDAFTAALVLGLLRRQDLGRIINFASRVAAYVCSQHGATPALPAALVADGH